MSIGKQYLYKYTLSGAFSIFAGILYLFDDNMFFNILGTIFLGISLFFMYLVKYAQKEINDEMAMENLIKAQSFTCKEIQVLIGIIVLITILLTDLPLPAIDTYINWKNIISPFMLIVFGIIELLIGLNFKKYEEV
jgi:hypothetical protein